MPELIVEPTPQSNNLYGNELKTRLTAETSQRVIAEAAKRGLAASAWNRQLITDFFSGRLVYRGNDAA
jgi:hypothetical protein